MKKMIKKVIAPVLVITVLFAVLRPFCIPAPYCRHTVIALFYGQTVRHTLYLQRHFLT